MLHNLILKADSYKHSHFKQYPPGTEYVSSYIEARKGGDAVFFGLQAFLHSLTSVDAYDVEEARTFLAPHGIPFNYDGWMHIVREHNGSLPVRIQAVPEGTIVPQGVPMVQIINTDPEVPWLTSFMETALLRSVWYPTTVATISWRCKKMIYEALLKTADNPDAEIDFKLHDFGARGVSSGESAAIGGAAHLVNFKGSDTVEALWWAREHYGAEMAGFSIPAAEHSTITAWGRDGELDAYRNMLDAFPKSPLVAVVSDSYSIYHACNYLWGGTLKDKVQRLGGSNRTLVIRPDSGDPLETLLGVFEILFDRFGYVRNSRGYKVLPKYLRVIQGDGISQDTLPDIIKGLVDHEISISNITFGMGGGLLQKCDRDTLSFAMKASQVTINGETRGIRKEPVTDAHKKSKMGRFAVVPDYLDGGKLMCVPEADNVGNILRTVYDGRVIGREQTLDDIRARAWERSETLV